MRIIGDKDLDEAGQKARFASAQKRASLATDTTEEYIANVKNI